MKVDIVDLTAGTHGWMVASAANGFAQTRMSDCSGIPFNYQPEYDTAKPQNIIPWAALETNISTQFEIGHFEPCRDVLNPVPFSMGLSFTDTVWQDCTGPYENTGPPDGGKNRSRAMRRVTRRGSRITATPRRTRSPAVPCASHRTATSTSTGRRTGPTGRPG